MVTELPAVRYGEVAQVTVTFTQRHCVGWGGVSVGSIYIEEIVLNGVKLGEWHSYSSTADGELMWTKKSYGILLHDSGVYRKVPWTCKTPDWYECIDCEGSYTFNVDTTVYDRKLLYLYKGIYLQAGASFTEVQEGPDRHFARELGRFFLPVLDIPVIEPVFEVPQVSVEEYPEYYRVYGTINLRSSSECPNCLQQIIIGVSEINTPVMCVYHGIPSLFTVDSIPFDVNIDKNLITQYSRKIVASKHLQYSCDDALNEFKQGGGERLLLHEITFPAKFEFGTITVSPKTVSVCQNVVVNVPVSNTGLEIGSTEITVTIGNASESRSITLNPGESVVESFELHMDTVGTFDLVVNDMTFPEAITVILPAELVIGDIGISKTTLNVCENVTITVPVTNIGGEVGSLEVVVSVGDKTQSKTVTLSPNESVSEDFVFHMDAAGIFSIYVNDISIENALTVEEVVPEEKPPYWLLLPAGLLLLLATKKEKEEKHGSKYR